MSDNARFMALDIDFEAVRKFERGCRDYPRIVTEEIGKAVKQLVLEIEAEAKKLCPVDTGKLRASIHPVVLSWAEGFIATNTEYAADVEFGTSPHDITPRSARALQIPVIGSVNIFSEKGRRLKTHDKKGKLRKEVVNNEMIYRKKARHPGTEPQPFLEPAFLFGQKRAPALFEQALQRSLDRLERSLA